MWKNQTKIRKELIGGRSITFSSSYNNFVPWEPITLDALVLVLVLHQVDVIASSEHFVCFAVPEKEVEAVAEALQFVFYSALNVRRLS
ncbi:hypothetical protein RJT34_22188 [Clitoria ternatea]|uniref:Uncharacterized protein n=1 Tax=Clitoria ternatea TaxID=43366 RepID=A0AAN9IV46_CLITE